MAFSLPTDKVPTIVVDPSKTYQSVDGFGFALTGGSAQHIFAMSPKARHELLKELFERKGNSIGISYLRVSIGASDLNDHVFSYDDMPAGQTDVKLEKFSIQEDEKYLIPVLKEILGFNSKIKILGSPWSAPAWMKTNNDVKGGMLKEEYYPVYAQYFVKYITEMKRHGITIDAVTLQNEPLNDGNTPSMQMLAKNQAELLKNDIGPAFKAARINTKVILYDHNCDAPEYPISILTDPDARQYAAGSGFHLYGGETTAMTKVHDAFPDKDLYFTEQMVVDLWGFDLAGPVSNIMIGSTRNWSRNAILWNLAADSKNNPHTDNGGCPICEGAITIDGDVVTRNNGYYTMAHFSKFVTPGSVRIDSNVVDGLADVAFQTRDGKTVVIVANTSKSEQKFNIIYKDKAIEPTLSDGAVATFVW